jgi:hypothetical protein
MSKGTEIEKTPSEICCMEDAGGYDNMHVIKTIIILVPFAVHLDRDDRSRP